MKNYAKPNIDVFEFDTTDIIQTSGQTSGGLDNDSNLNVDGMGGSFVPTSLE